MLTETVPQISATAAWASALCPMAAFAVIIVFLRRRKTASAAVSLSAITISLACAVYLLIRHWHIDGPMQHSWTWMVSDRLSIPVGVLLDPLSLLMLVIVTVICFLVQLYSLGYMAEDSGFSRYYAFMSLFAWSMTALVLAPNVVQLYVFWELVGVSSYLLIGFWFARFSASRAGKKAFVMTRLGDVAFFWGILLVLVWGGISGIVALNQGPMSHGMAPVLVTIASLLIFGGIIGKSAQFPLMTWLPDAMEGPTPVSALLHSATMVAAGVYLFARLFPFFSQSDITMTVCLAVGTISMLMAATMAMVSNDIKQVWAYSTISQLGFMIMALGAGGYYAGLFHLTTHAGFKALLFLCSGVLLHAFDSNDMFVIGKGGGRGLKIPMICMIIAAAALSGIWPVSGFFSKEAILSALAHADNPIWLIAALVGVFLTAYYTFRLIFIILFPKTRTGEAHDPAHGVKFAYGAMAWPLAILAAVTLVLGFFGKNIESFLSVALESTIAPRGYEGHGPAWLLPASLGLALAAVGLTWVEFGRKAAAQVGFVSRMDVLYRLFANRWYLDRIIARLVDRVLDRGAAEACRQNENRVVDAAVHGISRWTVQAGQMVAGWHQAMIQPKLMVMFVVVFGLTLILLIVG